MKSTKNVPQIDLNGVARRVEALRVALGLQKGKFSESFGLDPSSYSKVLYDGKPLKPEYGYAIAETWGVTMDFLYRGSLDKIEPDLRNKIIANLTAAEA